MNGTSLLDDFRKSRSESAFGQLVRRYTNLVYSVARRRTGDGALAQEITQLVFIRLARTPPRLEHDAELVGWLHRTTVNASIDLWRSECRRRAREELAVTMQLQSPIDETWHVLAPALDEALNTLPENDRQALLRRYFQQQTMRELGEALGISEDAAKMRVSRALERLRNQLSRQGVTCGGGAAVLGTLLAERAVEAAPGSLIEALAAARYPAAAGAAASWLALLTAAPHAKVVAIVASALLAGGGGLFLALHTPSEKGRGWTGSGGAEAALAGPDATGSTNRAEGDVFGVGENTERQDPDPLLLLLRVAQGRQRLVSGTMEFNLFAERLDKPVRETNYARFKAVFDGSKLWLESSRREYSYAQAGSEASKMADPIIEAQGLDREGAVRQGLLKASETRLVTASDGTNWMKYRETAGRPDGVTIDDPIQGASRSADYFFDFRCLGLSSFLHYGSTVEACLGYIQAKSIELVGREPVDGVEAWHVRVSKNSYTFDYWIDVVRPERLLKASHGLETVVSRFDPSGNDPIPLQVDTTSYRGQTLSGRQRFTRVSAVLDEPVDPGLWTLGGLGLPVGVPVIDLRVHQIIGYWNGVGLSASPPPARAPNDSRRSEPAVPVDRRELLATLDTAPGSEEGYDAAEWILLNTPDGPEVERAADAVQQHHLNNPRLLRLAQNLERFRHRCARPLLEGMLANNSNVEVQAAACFSLGALLMAACDHGKDAKVAKEAEEVLDRAVREFALVKPAGPANVNEARRALGELRQASIGKPAPGLEALGLDGRPFRLSELRGHLVVLTFWSCYLERDNHRALEETAAGKPVLFLGLNCCDDPAEKILAEMEEKKVKGRTVWAREERYGPVSKAWYVNSWPTIIVIDRAGTIRYRGHYSTDLHQMLKAMTGE